MILTTFKCDLCRNEVRYPYGGYRLTFSGDGAIIFYFLNEGNSDAIVCKDCVKGLYYAMSHIPKSKYEEDNNAG